jgi:hypothetical protein
VQNGSIPGEPGDAIRFAHCLARLLATDRLDDRHVIVILDRLDKAAASIYWALSGVEGAIISLAETKQPICLRFLPNYTWCFILSQFVTFRNATSRQTVRLPDSSRSTLNKL